jgi:hypothetical protein
MLTIFAAVCATAVPLRATAQNSHFSGARASRNSGSGPHRLRRIQRVPWSSSTSFSPLGPTTLPHSPPHSPPPRRLRLHPRPRPRARAQRRRARTTTARARARFCCSRERPTSCTSASAGSRPRPRPLRRSSSCATFAPLRCVRELAPVCAGPQAADYPAGCRQSPRVRKSLDHALGVRVRWRPPARRAKELTNRFQDNIDRDVSIHCRHDFWRRSDLAARLVCTHYARLFISHDFHCLRVAVQLGSLDKRPTVVGLRAHQRPHVCEAHSYGADQHRRCPPQCARGFGCACRRRTGDRAGPCGNIGSISYEEAATVLVAAYL